MSDLVRCFNEAVRGGDWTAYGECFTPDGRVRFDGVPVPELVGREAIVAGYTTAPPDDAITVLSTTSAGNITTIVYAWDTAPSVAAGTMTMELAGGLVSSLTVRLHAPAGAG